MSTRERLGFVGLGDIGAPMAMRILDAGHSLRVFNRTAIKSEPFVARGALKAATLDELSGACDIVFICVTDTRAVEQVVFGAGGLAEAGRPGQLIVDLSTIHPKQPRKWRRA